MKSAVNTTTSHATMPRNESITAGDFADLAMDIPPEQKAIRAKCFHPTGTFVPFEREEIEQSIPERFEKIVRKYPDRIAVKTRTDEVSYDEVNRAVNRLAHAILARRGEAQEPVALLVQHGLSLMIANLAVLKTGKFSVRLDVAAPGSRTAHLLKDSCAALILTDDANQSLARDWATGELALINVDELNSAASDQNPGLSVSADAWAYIRYTSGSTGLAKGALKTHRHVLHAVMNATNHFRICTDDRMTLLGRASLGKHVFEALLNGARLCLLDISEEGLVHLTNWLSQEGITIYNSFPTFFRYFVRTLSRRNGFPKLRLIRLEGEPVYRTDVDRYKMYFSSECLFVNSFSCTETGPICLHFVDKGTAIAGSRVPVGYPVEGMEVFLLDAYGKSVGLNRLGEVAVRSPFLSSEYWQRPELTREKFLSEPSRREQRVYLTGDLGQKSQDGCLELLGRKNTEIKIRSFRVALDEVEAALGDYPGVGETIVVAREDRFGDRQLVAYVVPLNDPPPTIAKLRDFLKHKVPEYMLPSAFVIIDKLPLTATGKIDRKSLPEPERSRPKLENPFVTAQTLIQEKLANIWAEVLNLDRVGIYDNFFDLGGHSLTASRIVSQVIKEFRLELSLRSLFQSPTVAAMAAIIDSQQDKKLPEEEMEIILNEVESIREEEAQRLLANNQEQPAKEIQAPRREQHSDERRQ